MPSFHSISLQKEQQPWKQRWASNKISLFKFAILVAVLVSWTTISSDAFSADSDKIMASAAHSEATLALAKKEILAHDQHTPSPARIGT